MLPGVEADEVEPSAVPRLAVEVPLVAQQPHIVE
jgi:hypothetical protein